MDATETKVYMAVLIATGVLAAILVYFIITVIRQQKRNLLLQSEKIQTEVNTLENERKRIASDLHDDLGPLLSAVRLQVNCLEAAQTEDKEIVERSVNQIDTILQRLREISNDLMPHALLRKGLVTATKEFINNIHAGHSLRIHLKADLVTGIPQQTEIHFYRIIHELIHNTYKHARATELAISLHIESEKLLVLVAKDNGKGFNYDPGEIKGLGLSNIMSRVEMMKGDIYLDTKPGYGTSFTIEVPFKKNGRI